MFGALNSGEVALWGQMEARRIRQGGVGAT